MKPIYLFSGLGADKRVFEELDFFEYDPTFIQWIQSFENGGHLMTINKVAELDFEIKKLLA
ncbi:MAG: hypothetical protein MUF58_00795 [Arcicella sp.]|jgi:hypothetical protein|nr:hypothetical protein [Arcicella sp.]